MMEDYISYRYCSPRNIEMINIIQHISLFCRYLFIGMKKKIISVTFFFYLSLLLQVSILSIFRNVREQGFDVLRVTFPDRLMI